MKKALISIITVVYNAHSTLEATICSVLEQEKELVEYWIIDGGSTDGSIDIIKKYENQLAGWRSEPDNGIYDAMNKGIKNMQGEWILFLGADDVILPGVISTIKPYLNSLYSVVFGDVLFTNSHRMRSFFGARTLFQNTVHHQSAFYNKSNFLNFFYNTELGILADYELNLKIYLEKKPYLYIPVVIARCEIGGASSNLSKSLKETNAIRAHYIKSPWKSAFLSGALVIYYAQKRIRYYLYGHRI
ncbi:hypothetical protein GCM10028808_12070 [Spirosoma migulaei]